MYNETHCNSCPGQLSHIWMKKKWCRNFVLKTNDTNRYCVICLILKIVLLEAALIVLRFWYNYKQRSYCLGKSTNNFSTPLFTNISKVCFLNNRCKARGLNKPNHSGNETKRSAFHTNHVLFLASTKKKYIYFEYFLLSKEVDSAGVNNQKYITFK